VSWLVLERDGTKLHGRDEGAGPAVVFQHGLGGSEAQVAEVFPDGSGFRRLTLECRGQGRSPLGGRTPSIAMFADDVIGFADRVGVERFVVGGISMGAAVALRIAVRFPGRVSGLVLARPAWLWDAAPPNMQPYAEVANYLAQPDVDQALASFERSATAQQLAREAPDNLASLKGFFAVDDRLSLATLLSSIAGDGPGVREAELAAITVPTLVIGNRIDAAHPFDYAEALSARISGSRLIEVTPKANDKARYVAEFRSALLTFLSELRDTGAIVP
jgi:pimeloyl-ACP methyl ester carboxylesterase